jgi:uncharacterized protein
VFYDNYKLEDILIGGRDMEVRDLMYFKNWVVIGDVTNETKYANKILRKLKESNYNVSGIHPKGGDSVCKSIKDVPYNIDVIDLCINPIKGIEYLKEANDMRIKYVLIQPGAESEEILNYCKENSITAFENCALVQLREIENGIASEED